MAFTGSSVRVTIEPQFSENYGTLSASFKQVVSALQAGTASGQSDRAYVATRQASTSGDLLDVSGTSLLQMNQAAFSVVSITVIAIANRSSTATLTVGGGSNPVLNIGMTIKPNGVGLLFAPTATAYTVAAGTGDIVKVASDAGTPDYDIFIQGRSA